MANLEDAFDDVQQVREEAEARGVSVEVVRQERLEASNAARQEDLERVRALINDPATLKELRKQWANRPVGSPPPSSALSGSAPEAPPVDPNAPPSSGRAVNPPRWR